MHEPQELVSVIIPFLNGSHWLEEAVESVINQTYLNWELILFDDGSERMHTDVAKTLCAVRPEKIRYAEHPGHVNRGVSISRNAASKLARGKYLAFLDADDVWLPNKLEAQMKMFAENPDAQIVFGAFTIWQKWNDPSAQNFDYRIGADKGFYKPCKLNKLLYPLKTGTTPAPSGIVITKLAFNSIGMFEAAFSGIHELYEDQAFLAKVFLHLSVYVSDESHLLYRRHEGSMSSAANNFERYHTVRLFYCDWLESYTRNQLVHDLVLRNLIIEMRENSIAELSSIRETSVA